MQAEVSKETLIAPPPTIISGCSDPWWQRKKVWHRYDIFVIFPVIAFLVIMVITQIIPNIREHNQKNALYEMSEKQYLKQFGQNMTDNFKKDREYYQTHTDLYFFFITFFEIMLCTLQLSPTIIFIVDYISHYTINSFGEASRIFTRRNFLDTIIIIYVGPIIGCGILTVLFGTIYFILASCASHMILTVYGIDTIFTCLYILSTYVWCKTQDKPSQTTNETSQKTDIPDSCAIDMKTTSNADDNQIMKWYETTKTYRRAEIFYVPPSLYIWTFIYNSIISKLISLGVYSSGNAMGIVYAIFIFSKLAHYVLAFMFVIIHAERYECKLFDTDKTDDCCFHYTAKPESKKSIYLLILAMMILPDICLSIIYSVGYLIYLCRHLMYGTFIFLYHHYIILTISILLSIMFAVYWCQCCGPAPPPEADLEDDANT